MAFPWFLCHGNGRRWQDTGGHENWEAKCFSLVAVLSSISRIACIRCHPSLCGVPLPSLQLPRAGLALGQADTTRSLQLPTIPTPLFGLSPLNFGAWMRFPDWTFSPKWCLTQPLGRHGPGGSHAVRTGQSVCFDLASQLRKRSERATDTRGSRTGGGVIAVGWGYSGCFPLGLCVSEVGTSLCFWSPCRPAPGQRPGCGVGNAGLGLAFIPTRSDFRCLL